jgi:phosphoribosylformylglycinamidine synthase
MLRIYVKYTIPDARAKSKKKYFEGLGLKNKIGAVRVADCYTVDAKPDKKQTEKAKMLLANPLMQEASSDQKRNVSFSTRSKTNISPANDFLPKRFDYAIEIGFLPGVTDNVGNTARETLADGAKIKFKPGQNVYSSQVFFISFEKKQTKNPHPGPLPKGEGAMRADIKKIANSLYNPLIQRATVKNFEDFKQDGGMDAVAPKVKLSASSKVSRVDLDIADEELIKLGKLGIEETTSPRPSPQKGREQPNRRGPLALGLEELKVIRDYFSKLKRKPTDVELETLAQTWSEHCKHTIFADPMDELDKGIYKTYIKGATEKIRKQKGRKDFCVSVFTDNAGAIIFDKDHIVSHKVETHNTPSALDPFGGSITGIVGVNRDILGFGLGAKPIANFYGFCLADPNDKTILYRSKPVGEGLKPSPTTNSQMLSARRIMDGVVSGINAGGNQSGIPTPLGFLNFDPSYRGKPLVFAGTLGLSPKKIGERLSWQKKAKPKDLIVTIGGRVGADGIHGATFSSEGLDKDSPATAVQIGDPITQKKLSDAVVKEARGQNLYNSITDCGAGGLSSAVGEMAGQSEGCEVYLDKVPLKYPGLAPWQIWISESQERMVLAVPKNKWQKFEKLMKARGVEATAVGQFTNSGRCVIKYGKNVVMDMDMEFLHNGRPIKHQSTQHTSFPLGERAREGVNKKDFSDQILKLLSLSNIASNEFISQQYDHEVGASSALKPLQGRGKINSEAAAIKPVLDSKKALVLSYGLHPAYSEINPYDMAACSIDSAVRAAVAAGANIDYLALLDNFCWCSSQDPQRLWQLKEAARACYDTATAYGTPFISGKDSMFNDFKGFDKTGKPLKISILPTLLISALGVVPDSSKIVSLDAKLPGDFLYILGGTDNELGASEYARFTAPSPSEGRAGERLQYKEQIPSVNSSINYQLYKTIFEANQNNLIASAISVNRGGLIVALIKKLMGGLLGAEISLADLTGEWKENYQALFSESQGRILVSVAPKNAAEFEKLMKENIFARIGKITAKPVLTITDKSQKQIVNLKITDALKAYRSTFKEF